MHTTCGARYRRRRVLWTSCWCGMRPACGSRRRGLRAGAIVWRRGHTSGSFMQGGCTPKGEEGRGVTSVQISHAGPSCQQAAEVSLHPQLLQGGKIPAHGPRMQLRPALCEEEDDEGDCMAGSPRRCVEWGYRYSNYYSRASERLHGRGMGPGHAASPACGARLPVVSHADRCGICLRHPAWGRLFLHGGTDLFVRRGTRRFRTRGCSCPRPRSLWRRAARSL